jgi:hypothetical protein
LKKCVKTLQQGGHMGVIITTIKLESGLAEKVNNKVIKDRKLTKTFVISQLLERWVKGEIKLEEAKAV